MKNKMSAASVSTISKVWRSFEFGLPYRPVQSIGVPAFQHTIYHLPFEREAIYEE